VKLEMQGRRMTRMNADGSTKRVMPGGHLTASPKLKPYQEDPRESALTRG
jgi:hypothetical protein